MLEQKQRQSKIIYCKGRWFVTTFLFIVLAVNAEEMDYKEQYSQVPEIASDAELSEMRGRFIRQGRPVYFGISMQSQWFTAGGNSINTGMNIGINLRKDIATDNRVMVDISLGDNDQTPSEFIPSSEVTIGGLNSTQGAVQAITVAGNDNQVHNETSVSFKFNSADQLTTENGQIFFFGTDSLSTSGSSVEITETTSYVDQNGVVSTAFFDENGVGVKIEVPEQGTAMQYLRSKNETQEGAGLFQTVQIEGDANQVFNNLNLIAEFAPTNATTNSIGPALDSLKALQGLIIQ